MKKSWFNFIEKDQETEFRQSFIGSQFLRNILIKMLDKKIEEHFKAQQQRTNYDESNWAFAQADSMGYCRALEEVKTLIIDKKQQVKETPKLGRPRKESYKPIPL